MGSNIDYMSNEEITAELRSRGKPVTGSINERKERLKECNANEM